MAKRSSTSVIACAICTEPISVASAAIGVPSAAERATRRIGPAATQLSHSASGNGRPAAAVRRLMTKVQVPISTRTSPCGGSGRCTGPVRMNASTGTLECWCSKAPDIPGTSPSS